MLVVVLFGVGSCGFVNVDESPITVVTYKPSGPGGDDALLQGVLATVDGCLVVEEIDAVVVPLLPANKVRYTRNGGIRLFGVTYHLGDTVSFGGGFTSRFNDFVIPQECEQIVATSPLFIAWN